MFYFFGQGKRIDVYHSRDKRIKAHLFVNANLDELPYLFYCRLHRKTSHWMKRHSNAEVYIYIRLWYLKQQAVLAKRVRQGNFLLSSFGFSLKRLPSPIIVRYIVVYRSLLQVIMNSIVGMQIIKRWRQPFSSHEWCFFKEGGIIVICIQRGLKAAFFLYNGCLARQRKSL